MVQFLEFIGNHPALTSMWMVTLGAIIFYHRRNSASSVAPQEAIMMINRENAMVVDVRERKEFESGHIVDSLNIPLNKLKQRLTELKKHEQKPLIVVCKLGQHSGEAAKLLQEAGHINVVRLTGGLSEWKAQSLPLVQN
tara:strand:+ start:364 stop:780 length:417 start_codon:yes stop_codon:yes gene_type:complete